MMAGNHGAAEAIKTHEKGASVGIMLDGLSETEPGDSGDGNDFTVTIEAMTLWERKQLLMEHTDIVVYAPGGLGTMDQVLAFECLHKLNRTEDDSIEDEYIRIFLGKNFWTDIVATYLSDLIDLRAMSDPGSLTEDANVSKKTMAEEWNICDSAEEAIAVIDSALEEVVQNNLDKNLYKMMSEKTSTRGWIGEIWTLATLILFVAILLHKVIQLF